ncbi:hypothetical protein OSB04_002874 [Centaurea solstitialis]|uniref:Retrotransposon gag domain-containing protein n=1 Tax=Centaurea solstitialis TaxID=347529 RepID=A0AA38TTQ7_9ASTR|nr:hypothetical protein OSB04_002874 [Centaurea solstitialis]
MNRLSKKEKLKVAVIAIEGDALKWFQWENKRHTIVTWEEFKKLLPIQFRSVGEGSLCEQFLAVKQETTVKDYKLKMTLDRSWISAANRLSVEYRQGVEEFIRVAKNHLDYRGLSRCSCKKCGNAMLQTIDLIKQHLFVNGIQMTYQVWHYLGESLPWRVTTKFSKGTQTGLDRTGQDRTGQESRTGRDKTGLDGTNVCFVFEVEVVVDCNTSDGGGSGCGEPEDVG